MLPLKTPESVEVNRIRQLICRVGDDGQNTFKKDISKVVEVISDYYSQNKPELRDSIINSFLQCATLLPLKAGIYATIFALLTTKQSTQPLADQIFQSLLDTYLQQIAQQNSPILGQTILKFLSELMNAGMLNTVNFVECLYDLGSGAEQENSPFYLQILLTTLPHTMIKAMEKNQIEFKNIIQNIDVLMLKRKQTDRLYHLWQAIRNFLEQNTLDNVFMKTSYPRPYLLFTEEMNQIKQIRRNFKIPFVKRDHYWRPQQILVPLEKQDLKIEMQNEIIKQWIYETIELFKTNKQQLQLQFEQYANCIRQSLQQENQFKQVLVNTLLNMIVEITPRKDQLSTVFYSGLLSQMSQRDLAKDWYEQIDNFIEQVPLNNILIIEQLSDFYSHYICNSTFKINWDKLFNRFQPNDDTESGYLNNYFVISTLRKLFLLVNIEKVKDLIPQHVVDWYQVQVDPTQYQPTKDTEHTETINQWLGQKIQGLEVSEKLQSLQSADTQELVAEFLRCLMLQISKSITHLNVLSKRYLNFLLQPKIVTQEQLGEALLDVIYKLWGHSTFHLKVYLKEFIGLEVISNGQLIKWLCSIKETKIKHSDFDDTNTLMNCTIAVIDVIKKQTYLDQAQEITYDNTKTMIETIKNYCKSSQENLMIVPLDILIQQLLILLKQGNAIAVEKLIKDLNLQEFSVVVMSF